MTTLRGAGHALLLCLALAVASCAPRATTDFHGVKLGMTPGDVRAKIDLPPGTWRANPGEEMTLDYSPITGDVPKVRFEFHSGMLVAIRATLPTNDPAASSLPLEVTPGAVLAREKSGPQSTALTWLSRDCPTHKDEAARLVKGGP